MRAVTPTVLVLALAAVLATSAGGGTVGVETIELRDVTLAGKVRFLTGFAPPAAHALSPTRAQFAYVPFFLGNPSDELRVSGIRGGVPVVIHAPGSIAGVAWAPAGRPIALRVSSWPEQGQSGIWLVEPDGTNLHRVADPGFGLSWSPDSRELATHYRQDGHRIDTIRVVTVATGATRDLAEGTGPTWSPDGRSILYTWEDQYAHTPPEIRVVPAGGGNPRTVATGYLYSPTWSPDGKRIAFIAPSRRSSTALWVIPSAGGRARLVAQGAQVPMWLPNGRTLAFTVEHSSATCGHRTTLSLVPLRGGKPRRLLVSSRTVVPLAWNPRGSRLIYFIGCFG